MTIIATDSDKITVSHNDVVVTMPAAAHDLNARLIEIDQLTDIDAETRAELYRVLAAEFRIIGYIMSAERCDRKADHYQWNQ